MYGETEQQPLLDARSILLAANTRIGDYVVKDSVGRLNVVRKNDFDRLYKKEEA